MVFCLMIPALTARSILGSYLHEFGSIIVASSSAIRMCYYDLPYKNLMTVISIAETSRCRVLLECYYKCYMKSKRKLLNIFKSH